MPTERSFGLSVGLVLAVIAAIVWWRGGRAAMLVGGVALGLIGAALVAPPLLRVPNRLWWALAQFLGRVNTRVVLTLLFFLVVTPVGLVMRLFGHDALRPRTPDSTWSPYVVRRRDPRHFERLF
jgi:hypothetical protein